MHCWIRAMATVTDPRSLLGKWLKDHPHSN
jgi:hypothetical protein